MRVHFNEDIAAQPVGSQHDKVRYLKCCRSCHYFPRKRKFPFALALFSMKLLEL